jgi:threonine/homoserine/homoserine lactone efflux protein
MNPEVWISFVIASAILVAIPGPANLFLITSTLRGGYRAGVPAIIGVGMGVFASVFLALLGVSSVLATSDNLFLTIKYAGAIYLIYLGVNVWRASGQTLAPGEECGRSRKNITVAAFLVSVLNPKVLMFYVAFLPQFIDPAMPVFLQAEILMATFVMLALMNASFWVFFAQVSARHLKSKNLFALANRTASVLLIVAGCSVVLFP